MFNLEKFAKLLVHYEIDLQKGDKVLIKGPSEAIPLIREIYREILKSGGFPLQPIIEFPDQKYLFHHEGNKSTLETADPLELHAIEMIDGLIMIDSRSNSRELANVPQEKLNLVKQTRFKIMQKFYTRAAKGELKWTMTVYPTNSFAQDSGMSQIEMGNLISKLCYLDSEDPTEEWKTIRNQQARICNYLNEIDKIRIIGKNTDLVMSVKGRKWMNSAGKGNMPDGEVYTGPIEDSAYGKIAFTYPLIEGSKKIHGIQLVFEGGKVVEASATENQDILDALLSTKGARYIGEIAIGTNIQHQNFIGNILFDEKMGGTIHLAIGNGYPETGSKQESLIHKDMILDMREEGEIWADDKLIYKTGKFLI